MPIVGSFLFLYQPPTVDGTEPGFEPQQINESFAVTSNITTNGETFMDMRVRYDATRNRTYVIRSFSDVTVRIYTTREWTYERVNVTTRERFEQQLEQTRADNGSEILRMDNSSFRFTARSNATELFSSAVPTGLFHTVLLTPAYERAGTTTYNGVGVTVYEPLSGWVEVNRSDDTSRLHVTETAGVLYVDEDTERLYYANVSYTFERGNSWGQVALPMGESASTELFYRFTNESVSVTEPAWVDDVR